MSMLIGGKGNLRVVKDTTDQKKLYAVIGKNIREARKAANMVQADVAKLLGVTTQQVQKYETGKSSMYVHTLLDLSQIFNLSLEQLITESVQTDIKMGKQKFVRDGFVDIAIEE